jgi:hypothetical protein
MSGQKFMKPSDSVKIRDPLDNTIDNGKIVNTPRFAQFGGPFKGQDSFGPYKSKMSIRKPSSK